MSKTNKILLIVLISILGLLIVAAAVLGVYAVGLYGKVQYDPDAAFASTVEVNDAFLTAYDRLANGEPLEEVIKDPNLTPEQIEILRGYVEELETDPDYTGTHTPISEIKPPEIQPPISTDGIMNILFLGTDERPGESRTRSDSMIVVSINTNTKEITFTSLMRDMYIEIVGLGRNNKINAAYRFGGVKMLNDTISTYLGIETDNYVRVDFESFKTVIDAIGGVDVPFSHKEKARNQEIKNLKSKNCGFSESQLVAGTEGTYHLNGEQALYFCRDRHSGAGVSGVQRDDFGRTERQRKVLGAIVQKAQSMDFDELLGALPEILPLVTTDLTLGDCTKLLTSVAATYKQYTVQNFRIPADGTWDNISTSAGAALEVDYAENARLWRELVYGE